MTCSISRRRCAHVLVRHEQGAAHAAEGYARSSGRVGVMLVTSGPGATNAITGLTDALMDSIPLICITGQVPTHLIGSDAFQECDTVGITRHCTKHNYLVRSIEDLPRVLHEAFYVAQHGRPGPVVIDIPKDVQFARGEYFGPKNVEHKTYHPRLEGDPEKIEQAVSLMAAAKRPVFYTGGGVINSGPEASRLLRDLVAVTGFPVTSTLMGLGAFPAHDPKWLGMLGMHGTYEANNAMHDCDLIIAVGSRFDDRITGRLDQFSPGSKKIHIDIDPSSINKNVKVDLGIIGDCAHVIAALLARWKARGEQPDAEALSAWWAQIDTWRARKSLAYQELGQDHQAAICDRAALCGDQGARHLCHDRGRPASDVGRAIFSFRRAQPLDDQRRSRHDGLWPARGHRHADGPSRMRSSSILPAKAPS